VKQPARLTTIGSVDKLKLLPQYNRPQYCRKIAYCTSEVFENSDFTQEKITNEPHRLRLQEMEYTTMPQVTKKLKGRFIDLD